MKRDEKILNQLKEIRKIRDPKLIPAKYIHLDPSNPRQDFWQEPIPRSALRELKELASSIEKQGLINPILISVAYEEKGKLHYKLVDGERRFRAITQGEYGGLGRSEILAQVIEIQDPIAIDLIRFTVQRTNKNWDPFAQAYAEKSLLEKLGGNISAVAKFIGVSRQSIMNHQKIFQLKPESLQHLKDSGKQLTYAREAAKLIDTLTPEDKESWPSYEKILVEKIISGKIGKRDELVQLIAAFKSPEKGEKVKKQFFEEEEYTAKMAIEASGIGSENTAKEAEIKAERLIEMLSLDASRLRAADNTKLKIILRTLRSRIDTFLT